MTTLLRRALLRLNLEPAEWPRLCALMEPLSIPPANLPAYTFSYRWQHACRLARRFSEHGRDADLPEPENEPELCRLQLVNAVATAVLGRVVEKTTIRSGRPRKGDSVALTEDERERLERVRRQKREYYWRKKGTK